MVHRITDHRCTQEGHKISSPIYKEIKNKFI